MFDAAILVVGALGSLIVWPRSWWLGFVTAFVVGHFFLFCNVFRVSRPLELIWAMVFLVLARLTEPSGRIGWKTTVLISFATTMAVVGIELRKPSYHGVGWSRVNPGLRQWWEVSRRE